VQPLPVADVRVGCRAPDSVDAAGSRVHYSPELLTDGDPGTAWRCAGPGRGETVEFTLAKGARIAQLGLLNGYAKVDPVTGDNRYGEYRRVRQVRWTFDDGFSVTQDLRDKVESVQTIRIPVRSAQRVTLTIVESTTAGSAASSRNAVLLSEATFAGPST
jgi:hypothetical protein